MSRALPAAPSRQSDWVQFFDELAPTYEEAAFGGSGLAAVSRRELDALRRALARALKGRVLDAGAGTGRISRQLVTDGWSVTALDVSAAMLARVRTAAPGARPVLASLDHPLPFRSETFDAVVCLRVLKYVEDLHAVLTEFSRLLRPGGILVAEFANRRSVARFGYRHAPVRTDSRAEFERALTQAGIAVVTRSAGPRLPQPVWSAARRPAGARVVGALDGAIGTVLGGTRATLGSRSVIVGGQRL